MLAYTNRFLAYASVIRSLKTEHEHNPTPMAQRQIDKLCVVCTLFIYVGWQLVAVYTFGVALLLLVISLAISIRELLISVKALEYRLDNVKIKKEGEESC